MTRKRSLTAGVFSMPQALTDTALAQLTPEQRAAIRPEQAGAMMRLMVDTAEHFGRILAQPAPSANTPPPPIALLKLSGGPE